ncbi:MAG: UDP-4-amino-4,6-dideoxy-N-acetyl-beta-L-altrosamine transaminase [Lachnospiraceae bacterium]|jgi:UDP-4-amino-4,6-dideoxy-N-acetyl-beta-L-altrosamine transaminase|nr:UDP-4-amino-4,6-dideoxy-N-acetyl-beta-L-altrosamine transaminase [Lachnospiraceae bacterium]
MEKPAIYGGIPIREKKLYYGRQYIDEADIEAVTTVLRSDWLTCGPQIAALEDKLCHMTGAKYAISCANGTAALHIACLAAGVEIGDEVITSPLTFAASANCALYCGATPIFADIDMGTLAIDPEAVRAAITTKTKAVIAVDYAGQSAAMDELVSICQQHGLILISDAAHSIGTKYKGKAVGSIADMTTFSFHPVKSVTCGEGGAVLTNDEDYYRRLRLFREHGITRKAELFEKPSTESWYYEQIVLGYNYRLTDIQAVLLSSQLDKLEMFSNRRKEIITRYREAFRAISGITMQEEIAESETTSHLFVIRIDSEALRIGRDEFIRAMAVENIICNLHYIPVYHHPYYQNLGYQYGLCPNVERVFTELVTLPLHYGMSDEDTEDVIHAVEKIVRYHS